MIYYSYNVLCTAVHKQLYISLTFCYFVDNLDIVIKHVENRVKERIVRIYQRTTH